MSHLKRIRDSILFIYFIIVVILLLKYQSKFPLPFHSLHNPSAPLPTNPKRGQCTLPCRKSKALPTTSRLSKVYLQREYNPKKPIHAVETNPSVTVSAPLSLLQLSTRLQRDLFVPMLLHSQSIWSWCTTISSGELSQWMNPSWS